MLLPSVNGLAIFIILVTNIRIFEYSNIRYQNYEYSNIFVYQNFNIRIRISNIRKKLFEYSNILEYSLITGLESLTSHWTNSSGHCRLSPLCNISEDIIHFLKTCSALDQTRRKLYTEAYCASHPVITSIIQTYCTHATESRRFCQFILDCSVLPEVIVAVQNYGPIIHTHLFNISRIWCYTLHRERLKLLNRWRNFAKSWS